MDNLLSVTIILPVRNEAQYIARCLDGVVNQDYAADKIEILVADGMSEDGTREIVLRFAEHNPRVRLLDNPEGIVPTALNRGVREAGGDVIIRVDGHAVIAKDYVRRCIADLQTRDAACVGGPIRTIGETTIAQAIALAQSSPFGVGNAAFRYATVEQYVDTLAFGAYRRNIFERIGLFDEELRRNQDDEFNFRLVRSGGKIWLDPAITSTYFSRTSFPALWHQYFDYGFWKVRVIQKHGRPASWRHLIPAALVLGLVGSAIVAWIMQSPVWILIVVLPYLVGCVGASVIISARRGWRFLPRLPIAFATMHFAYGFGFLAGMVRWNFRPSHPKITTQRKWTS